MITLSDKDLTVTGVQITYHLICPRKLWLFSHQIQMEQNSQLVSMGSVIHEYSYSRKRKEIQIGPVKVDFFEKNRARISEIKKSRSIEEAHIWQMKYYLFYFKSLGIRVDGRINYPVLRKGLDVVLTKKDEEDLIKMITTINHIVQQKKPPPVKSMSICKKCSYYEFCFS